MNRPSVVHVPNGSIRAICTSTGRLRIDTLTAVMLVVITPCPRSSTSIAGATCTRIRSQPRFFAYLSLFTFAMLMLVTADNLVQMFFGWEGVGLASYLLIGFWYQKPSANAAAIKAFVVNRVGDFGFMLGIFMHFLVFGTCRSMRSSRRARHGESTDRFPRPSSRYDDHALPAAVRGRHGQVGAAPACTPGCRTRWRARPRSRR
jgi:NADH:ubiquinone oxidoreductase subunit 5 (subunit L)/multisubunit Na+/H+ antiporter MnhA subunit